MNTTVIALILWFFISLGIALSGVIANMSPLLLPVLIWAPAIIGFFWFGRAEKRPLRDNPKVWIAILLYHGIIRIGFGGLFIFDYTQGNFPASFAFPAGIGDIIAGALALALIATKTHTNMRLLTAWNIFAFLDILSVFFNVQRLVFVEQDMVFFQSFTRLPYPMLPTIVVPLIMMSHLLLAKVCWQHFRTKEDVASWSSQTS